MKTITLWEPWASAMAWRLKKIETRHWATSYRGPLAIHAASRRHEDDREALQQAIGLHDENFEAFVSFTDDRRPYDRLPFGCVLAYGRLVDCVKFTPEFVATVTPLERDWGNFEIGRYGWIFEDIRTHPRGIPVKGAQGLWNLPPDIEKRLMAQSAAIS